MAVFIFSTIIESISSTALSSKLEPLAYQLARFHLRVIARASSLPAPSSTGCRNSQPSPKTLISFIRHPLVWPGVGTILAYCSSYSIQRASIQWMFSWAQLFPGRQRTHPDFSSLLSPDLCTCTFWPLTLPRSPWAVVLTSQASTSLAVSLLCPSGWSYMIFFKLFWWPLSHECCELVL